MPAPAVYVLAILGTVGAALVFKEFVYDPHIVPAIDRWKAEYQAAKRRREMAAIDEAQAVVQMSQTRKGKSKSKGGDKLSDEDDDSSDDENHLWNGKGASSSSSGSKLLKGGLLRRRPEVDAQNQRDVELDNLVATEVSEWRKEAPGQVLRQRKNVSSEHAMDESNHAIPYTPLSPLRTHVVFDPTSPSTSNSESRVHSSSQSPNTSASPLGLNTTGGDSARQSQASSLEPVDRAESPSKNVALPASPVDSHPESKAISPPPHVTPFQHTITQSVLLGHSANAPPTFNLPTANPSLSPPPPPMLHELSQVVQSLSQSYPQELDYERGLELISPPSSRSESPFSMAEISPTSGLRALSPTSAGSRPMSGFSSAMSSPSPLRMGLGNQSYDAVSPPALHAQSSILNPSTSVTDSARSTTYLSFDELSDDGDDSLPQSYTHLAASTGVEGTFGPASIQPSMLPYQPTPIHPTLLHGHMYTNNSPPMTYAPPRPAMPQSGMGPELFPVAAREPRTPAAASMLTPSAYASVAAGAGAGNPSYFRASNTPSSSSSSPYLVSSSPAPAAAMARSVSATQSDIESDLSDLDFMSDYQPSEAASDAGNESDSSWSMAGGSRAGGSSAAGSPMLSASGAPANLARGATIRANRSSRFA